MTYNKKGFTLIEMLVALGLFSIIISLVITFFTNSLKNYNSIHSEVELEFQAQYILNFMFDKIMESESVAMVRKDDIREYSLTYIRSPKDELSTNKIAFKYGNLINENYVFHIVNKSIRYGRGEKDIKSTVELGNYVKVMFVSLLKEENLRDANVLKIKIILEKNNQLYEAEQVVYMRNN